ncbi:hypothetical protein C0992_001579 [Termitomyces sp. T32_za158]|nr:hypothetical protein C0992_001579 [Termitomyces sp. T32_za158]
MTLKVLSERILKNPDSPSLVDKIDGFLRAYPYPLVVTHEGTSQPCAAGALCAANFIQYAFTKHASGTQDRDLLRRLLTHGTFSGITSITQHYQRTEHLKGSEIVGQNGLPYFTCSLDLCPPVAPRPPTLESFERILEKLDDVTSPISAALISNPSVFVAALKLPVSKAPKQRLYVLFDPHRLRPYYPNGAAMVVCSTAGDAAQCLALCFQNSHSQLDISLVKPNPNPIPSKCDKSLLDRSMDILHSRIDGESRSKSQSKPLATPTRAQQQHKGNGSGSGSKDRNDSKERKTRLVKEPQQKQRVYASATQNTPPKPSGGHRTSNNGGTSAARRPENTSGNARADGHSSSALTRAPARPANIARRSNTPDARGLRLGGAAVVSVTRVHEEYYTSEHEGYWSRSETVKFFPLGT